jgi:hypothetical protein
MPSNAKGDAVERSDGLITNAAMQPGGAPYGLVRVVEP